MDEIDKAFWEALEALGARDGWTPPRIRGRVHLRQVDCDYDQREDTRYYGSSPRSLEDMFKAEMNRNRLITLHLIMPPEVGVFTSGARYVRPDADFESTAEEITNHAGELPRPVKELEQ